MTIAGLSAPVHLAADHELESFDCGEHLLNDWLKRYARRNELSGASRTYVVCIERRVVGYYSLSTGAIARAEAPKQMQRNMPDPIPVVVLGRLAVDREYHGHGIGSGLLRDATFRVLHTAEPIGIKALLVHAISAEAKQFYLRNGFLESPMAPMTLCLVLGTVRDALTTYLVRGRGKHTCPKPGRTVGQHPPPAKACQ